MLVQVVYLRQQLAVERLLGARAGLEVLDTTPELGGKRLRARARPSLFHQGPLLLHGGGFALRRLLGRIVLLPHEEEREPDRHAEHHVESRVDYAGGGVVRLAERQGHQALYQDQPRERHGQQNDQNAEESRS